MALTLKKDEIGGKTLGRNCAHARNQICQTSSEVEEKFRDVIDVWTGF